MYFDLELNRLLNIIAEKKLKKILLQIPDGLKPKANQIIEEINLKTNNNCKVFIWFNSCYGACDIPTNKLIDKFKIDEIIQLGHSKWN